MGTNKTRLFISEFSGARGPYNVVNEFDIYQEAYDYAYSAISNMITASTSANDIIIWLFSYDNTSYQMAYNGTSIQVTEISFPS